MIQASELQRKFQELYGAEPRVYRAPGRVNLIGEHTDYNDGFVLPAAIDLSTWVAIAARDDRRLVIHSENFAESVEFDLDATDRPAPGHWSNYLIGVARVLERAGQRLCGANLLIRGEVPIGSGLSSSAAIEVATGLALLDASGLPVDRTALALAAQRAEHEFAGTMCGIMDQFISCYGREDHALLLDCRSLEFKLLPLRADVRLVVCNTMVKHDLASGEYNVRRAECEEGVRRLVAKLPGVRALRGVTLKELERHERDLPEVIFRRCRHVISENARTLEAAEALEQGDLARCGELMNDSHHSLRDDYEVSCAELDLMVELARRVEGVYGARMTGGGFGGCTVNLVGAASVAAFKQAVAPEYERLTGIRPEVYIFSAAEGAERIVPRSEG